MGAKVLLVEKDKVGGTCLNYGCIPTKAIISSVDLFNKIKKNHGSLELRLRMFLFQWIE